MSPGSASELSTVSEAVVVVASSVREPVWSAPADGASLTLPTWAVSAE